MRADKKINILLESFWKHRPCTQDETGKCDLCIGYLKKINQILKDGETVSISKDSPLVQSFKESLNQPEPLKGNRGSEEPF